MRYGVAACYDLGQLPVQGALRPVPSFFHSLSGALGQELPQDPQGSAFALGQPTSPDTNGTLSYRLARPSPPPSL